MSTLTARAQSAAIDVCQFDYEKEEREPLKAAPRRMRHRHRQLLRRPTVDDIQRSPLRDEFLRVYLALGGKLRTISLNLKKTWDIEFDGVALELDEQLHFNRYRALTLNSACCKSLRHFPLRAYQQYCEKYEERCLAAGGWGKRWSSSGSEKQFGPSSPPGTGLDGNGSSRWKQRAFYDFVKDFSPSLVGVTVVRLSIWDTIVDQGEPKRLGDVLDDRKDVSSSARDSLLALVNERLG